MLAAESPDFLGVSTGVGPEVAKSLAQDCKATAADGGNLLGVAYGWGLRMGIDRNFGLKVDWDRVRCAL